MSSRLLLAAGALGCLAALAVPPLSARADGDLHKVNHVIIVMQENHSFDNYFGALPYVRGGPYHGPGFQDAEHGRPGGGCSAHDHRCVDGLRCVVTKHGEFRCANSNPEEDGSIVFAFHEPRYCTGPDLDHGWSGSHIEANFHHPELTFFFSPNDGFVRRNDALSQPDTGLETPTDDDTIGFYTQDDLPFYYGLAQTFAIDDRYFCSVIGPTFPNRAYELAATSFGHLTTSEILPPPTGYKPITGSMPDLLDEHGVSWTNYFSDVPATFIFRPTGNTHVKPMSGFFADAAAGTLPQVSFVDPNFGFLNRDAENDEHPPTNIRKGEKFVSDVVNAVRNGPNWKDSIIFITYDEHGGFYDHVPPARARQGGAPSPDGIAPGQCADLSNPPSSMLPGGGVQCDISRGEAAAICPGFTPTGPYPATCPNFDQLGFRVPFIAVSPFSKPHYVSHTVGDHTSLLAFIEKRFMTPAGGSGGGSHPALTARDANADTLEDLFDFTHAPSLNAPVPTAPGPSDTDPGCPFVPASGDGSGSGTF